MTEKRYSKVEEEVIKILNEMEDGSTADPPANLVQFRPRPKQPRRAPRHRSIADAGVLRRIRRYSAGSWLGVGVFAIFVAWGFGRFIPILGMLALLAALMAFVAAFYVRRSAPSLSGLRSPSGTKRWRGRDIDLTPPSSSGGRLRARWQRWRNRRA